MVDTAVVESEFIKLDTEQESDSEIESEDDETVTEKVPNKKVPNVVSGSRTAMLEQDRGIVYLSHIPFGFFEKEMYRFFSQFGSITNLRLGRSKKTGASKGYAFIEFRYSDVAKIVAETMNNYLMFEKLLKCKIVPNEQVKASMFKGKVDPKRPQGLVSRLASKKKINATRTDLQEVRRSKAFRTRAKKLSKKLAELGIDIPMIDILREQEKTSKKIEPDTKEKKLKAEKNSEPNKKQKLDTKPEPVKKQKLESKSQEKLVPVQTPSKKLKVDEKPVPVQTPGKKQKLEEKPALVQTPGKKHKLDEKVPVIETKTPAKKQKTADAVAAATPVAEQKQKIVEQVSTTAEKKDKKKKLATPAKELKPAAEPTVPTSKVLSTPLPVQKVNPQTPKVAVATPKPDQKKVSTATPKQVQTLKQIQTPKMATTTPKQKSKAPAKSPGVHLDLSVLLGRSSPPKKVTNTPKEKDSKKTPKNTPAAKVKTPNVMEVDSDEDEITLKTPPNIQKIKSRSNSRAASSSSTPIATAINLQKGMFEKLASIKKASTPSLESAAKKLSKIAPNTPSTPKVKKNKN